MVCMHVAGLLSVSTAPISLVSMCRCFWTPLANFLMGDERFCGRVSADNVVPRGQQSAPALDRSDRAATGIDLTNSGDARQNTLLRIGLSRHLPYDER
jgi:hypothetical protein